MRGARVDSTSRQKWAELMLARDACVRGERLFVVVVPWKGSSELCNTTSRNSVLRTQSAVGGAGRLGPTLEWNRRMLQRMLCVCVF